MIAISEKISDPVVNMPYLRLLLFILILGPVLQPASGQELPGVNATPPSSIIGPTLVTRRQRITEPANDPPNVTSLTFDRPVIYSSCAGKPAAECDDDGAKIRVTTVAEDKENDLITYKYTVIAGRIIGQGPSVIWDLSGVPAGKYSIVARSDDGCGDCGRTMTKEIEVRAAPDVEKITLSKKEINSWCPNHKSPESMCPKEKLIVEVTTTAKNMHDGLMYYYGVTGGKIIGEGPKVKWDLGDTTPGRYSITAGIGKDDLILGKIAITDITEKVCPVCDLACSCPLIEVSGPRDAVKPGDIVIFSSKANPAHILPYRSPPTEKLSFTWSVSDGTILNDPASSSIMVKIPSDFKGAELTAFFTILTGTDPTCGCLMTYPVPVTVEVVPPTRRKPIPQPK
jgi:hypothetical protein